MNKLYPSDVEALRQQLAECQKEREEARLFHERENMAEQLAECRKERDELVVVLEAIASTRNPDPEIRAEIRWELAETALAKLGKGEK